MATHDAALSCHPNAHSRRAGAPGHSNAHSPRVGDPGHPNAHSPRVGADTNARSARVEGPEPAIKVILIHGNGGCTAADGWLPYVERELRAPGLEVVNQTFPDNVKARAGIWLPFIEALGADDRTILIGHSSGAVAAMRYAETHRLLGSVLVAVCHTDLGDPGERASGYYRDPWRWADIRAHQQWIGIFQSRDDPHIPVAEARFIAAQLECRYFEFADRGHFVDREPFTELVQFVRRRIAAAPGA